MKNETQQFSAKPASCHSRSAFERESNAGCPIKPFGHDTFLLGYAGVYPVIGTRPTQPTGLMIRDDVSDNLIHLSKDTTDLTAANALLSILKEKKLRGGSTFIKGAYTCVCFSEAPIGKLAYILAEPSVNGIRYKPFGIMVGKKWLYERGGAPCDLSARRRIRTALRGAKISACPL